MSWCANSLGVNILVVFPLVLACNAAAKDQATPDLSAAGQDTVIHPIVDVATGQLFGASKGGTWLSADSTASSLSGGETYRLYTLTEKLGEGTGTSPAPPEVCSNWSTDVSPRTEGGDAVIALGAQWDALPRVPKLQPSDQQIYRDAVSTLLRTHEIADIEVRIAQILRVDLEGDGIEEVVLSASNLGDPSPNAPRGSYSVVVLRKLIADSVATFPLEESYYPDGCTFCGPVTHSVVAILDLTGDDVMEIITAFKHYEGEGKNISSVVGPIPEKILGWSCGV